MCEAKIFLVRAFLCLCPPILSNIPFKIKLKFRPMVKFFVEKKEVFKKILEENQWFVLNKTTNTCDRKNGVVSFNFTKQINNDHFHIIHD